MTDTDRPSDNGVAKDERGRLDPAKAADTLKGALSGSDVGSDTRAGSLRGGSASGSDIDPDQAEINAALAEQGRSSRPDAVSKSPQAADDEIAVNTGDDTASTAPQKDADAATG